MFWRLLGPMMIVFLLVALVFPRLVRRAVLRSLDALFVMLYGRKLEPSPTMPDEARGLFDSVEQFQESLREHVDEQARLASLGAAASFLAHDVRNLLASLQLNAERADANGWRSRAQIWPQAGKLFAAGFGAG